MSEKSAGSVRSAQRVIEALTAQGVRYIFGVPGAKVDEVYDGLDDLGHGWWCAGISRMRRSWPPLSAG